LPIYPNKKHNYLHISQYCTSGKDKQMHNKCSATTYCTFKLSKHIAISGTLPSGLNKALLKNGIVLFLVSFKIHIQ